MRGCDPLVNSVSSSLWKTHHFPRWVSRRNYMLRGVTATPEYYERVVDAFQDTESLTVLTVAGRSRDQVAAVLGVDLNQPVDDGWSDNVHETGWAILEIAGGVLAVELSGYGDPALPALLALSENGGASAVVRSNIQANLRFGCARNGELLFDDNEYIYIDDPAVVPGELRPLFDLAWDDLEGDDEDDEMPDGFVVGLAMAEVITGVQLTADQVAMAYESGFFKAPSLVYVASLGGE